MTNINEQHQQTNISEKTKEASISLNPGALFQAYSRDRNVRLFKIPYDALVVLHGTPNTQTYQHHLVTDKFLHLTGDEYLFLIHFFISPSHIQYYPNEHVVKRVVDNNNKDFSSSCVAYFMYDNNIWASNLYKSVDDFMTDFKIIVE